LKIKKKLKKIECTQMYLGMYPNVTRVATLKNEKI